jgi:hypothetical protein
LTTFHLNMGVMSGEDAEGDHWLTMWEAAAANEIESRSDLDIEAEQAAVSQKLWISFQNTATAIAQVRRALAPSLSSNSKWRSLMGVIYMHKGHSFYGYPPSCSSCVILFRHLQVTLRRHYIRELRRVNVV